MRKVGVFLCGLLFSLAALLPIAASAADRAPQKILFIRSYGIDEGCGVPMERAVQEYLSEMGYIEGKDIVYSRFCMDTRSVHVSPEAKQKRAEMAIEIIKSSEPDLVITFDDVAFSMVVLPLVDTKYKFVMAGVNVSPEDYNAEKRFMESREHPGHNVTGVTEEAGSDTALQLLKKIVPEAKTMVFLCSKGGAFWEKIANATVADMKEYPDRYPFTLLAVEMIDNFEDYKKAVNRYNSRKDVDVIYNFGVAELRDKPHSDKGVREDEVMRWILQNQTKPETTWAMDWVQRGYLCGAGIDPYLSGKQLAVQVNKILKGENPGDLPIEKPRDFAIGINLARAQQLGVTVPFNILGSASKVFDTMIYYPEFKYKSE